MFKIFHVAFHLIGNIARSDGTLQRAKMESVHYFAKYYT